MHTVLSSPQMKPHCKDLGLKCREMPCPKEEAPTPPKPVPPNCGRPRPLCAASSQLLGKQPLSPLFFHIPGASPPSATMSFMGCHVGLLGLSWDWGG